LFNKEVGVAGSRITFPFKDGTSEGYLAIPTAGAGAGVIVLQEWWGLVPHIEDICDRVASAGFTAMAPDM